MARERLLIVSPVFNEGAHIEKVIAGMAAQSRPPDEWIVIDDGSTDATVELLRRAERCVPFLRVASAPPVPMPAHADRLLLASEARAFNHGLGLALSAYTHVGKLDGDIELPPHYYEQLLRRFGEDQQLGLAGGVLSEPTGGSWRVRGDSDPRHVRGALKLYTRACHEVVGGVREVLGWDAIDEVLARMHGYRTRSFADLVARHHRVAGSAQGRLRGQRRLGRAMYVEGYPPTWIAARSLKVAVTNRPRLVSAVAFSGGYAGAAVRRVPRYDADGYRPQLLRELRARRLVALKSALSG